MLLDKISKSFDNLYPLTMAIMISIGVVLAVYNFLLKKSFNIDEAWLALNFLNRGYWELTQALENLQVAPIIFLWIQKFFFDSMPWKDLALRILPLINFFISLFLFQRILEKSFDNRYLKILGMGLFAMNFYLIEYAVFVKQYMGDVMLTVLFLWLLQKNYEREEKRLFHLMIAGGLGIFYSHITPILIVSAGVYLLIKYKSDTKKLFPLFILWGTVFILYYFIFVDGHELKEEMTGFWKKTMGFFPELNQGRKIYTFFKWKWVLIFRDMLSMWSFSKYLIFILFLSGLIFLFQKRNYQLLVLLFLPMLIHFSLSFFELYPFEPRLILYFIPLLILLILQGIAFWVCLFKNNLKLSLIIKGSLFLFLGISIFKTFEWKFPSVDPGIKGGMKIINPQLSNEINKVYMSTIFYHAYRFYDEVNFVEFQYKPYIISDEDWNALSFTPHYDWNALSILPQTEREQGVFFIIFPLDYTNKTSLIEEIKKKKGKVLNIECYGDCCVLKMTWNTNLFVTDI
jgi:hypothetical protein